MTTNTEVEEAFDYGRMAKAIAFIHDNFKEQPSLEEIAEKVHMSPFHFQRTFTQWAGISPKKYLQFTTSTFAKQLMKGGNFSLNKIAYSAGLSGSSRLHDLFVTIDGMSPGEYKSKGSGMSIAYGLYDSIFGKVLLASTEKGICKLSFYTDEQNAIGELFHEWPLSKFFREDKLHAETMERLFNPQGELNLTLNIKGTPFQLKVWEALLNIPEGEIAAYQDIGQIIEMPTATRAIGSAIGKNPVAKIIPCHRVIKKVGGIGEYRWGSERKLSLLGWEQCQVMERKSA